VGVEVYSGNTGDPTTVPDQVEELRGRFGLERIVLVGDRGMLTQARIDQLKEFPQLGWISALRSDGIRKLLASGVRQLSLFDRQDLAEIVSPDFPGERLVVCFNPLLHDERRPPQRLRLAGRLRQVTQNPGSSSCSHHLASATRRHRIVMRLWLHVAGVGRV